MKLKQTNTGRRQVGYSATRTNYRSSTKSSGRKPFKKLIIFVVLCAVVFGTYSYLKPATTKEPVVTKSSTTTSQTTTTTTTVVAPKPTACSTNSLSQLVLVSISQRELWACQGSSQVYSSAVITGIEFLPADLTPTGTYHIYSKLTNQVLKGCDSTGCWNDPVSYWMPFLDNQYGVYGFHDATWRSPSDFGNISPNSSKASHGCVECPLTTAQWLYGWSHIGTTVTIQT
jgi:lipoprotein-anchoring transpeptidase ErfK/SrfK